MIRATGVLKDAAGERPVLIVGLLPENTGRLMEGDPIIFEAAEMDLDPLRVVILGGQTPEAIRDYLAPITTPGTVLHAAMLTDQRVDWRAVAGELAEAAALAIAGVPEGAQRLVLALGRYSGAREREGL